MSPYLLNTCPICGAKVAGGHACGPKSVIDVPSAIAAGSYAEGFDAGLEEAAKFVEEDKGLFVLCNEIRALGVKK